MKKNMNILIFGISLMFFSLACIVTATTPTPVQQQNLPVLNTPVPQSEDPTKEQVPDQPVPTTVSQDYYAPDPLTVEWTDNVFNLGGCVDLDNLQNVTDTTCDVALDSDGGLITPQNGASFSGYANLTPPSKNQCIAASMSGDPLGLMSDLYLCFRTNKGTYGFFVLRRWPDPANGSNFTVYDAYLFP